MLDLARAGLPAALTAGQRRTGRPGRAAGGRPVAATAAAADRSGTLSRSKSTSRAWRASVGDGAGVVPEWYEAPTFYFTNPYALVGPYDDVPVPPGSELLDFELEVAVVDRP